MLTFFRKFRKSLLGEGATSRYLLYAIGEITLVVIGILIALQINNWNQDRKDRIEERLIVKSVYEEMKDFGTTTPTRVDSASVLMLDFVNFTEMSVSRDPSTLVAEPEAGHGSVVEYCYVDSACETVDEGYTRLEW